MMEDATEDPLPQHHHHQQQEQEQEQELECRDDVLEWKSSGNTAYAQGDYSTAIEKFSEGINVMKIRLCDWEKAVESFETTNESEDCIEMTAQQKEMLEKKSSDESLAANLFCNRGICYSGLENWTACVEDCQMAIRLNAKYEKAYFRLVKALLELRKYKEARLYLVIGLNSCPESKFLKALDTELTAATGVPCRPKPTDFDIIEELGDGNFSKIFKAKYKPTNKVYAVKTIEKQTVERMKRRHKNIHNEILMEKKVLNKLSHPNIVTLYATFQDYGTLYYQMELMAGEVWTLIQDDIGGSYEKVNRGSASSVGCYFSLTRFLIMECLDALEYMHRNGITHRDLKPENMMITAAGHLKLVDFGTCKDLRQTDLNGQEFVGTAEYMSPEVIDSEDSGPAADLWSLGVVLFYMVMGYTPFRAPSPYLTFLRIKRAFLRLPILLPNVIETNEVLTALLEKSPSKRLLNATGNLPYDPLNTKGFSYDKLRSMTFFREADSFSEYLDKSSVDLRSDACGVCGRCAVRVPTLREMAVRAVANTSLIVAERIAANGGVRNAVLPKWVQNFMLHETDKYTPSARCLDPSDRASIMLYLQNKAELHSASVYRLFFKSVIDSRNIRTDFVEREYIGYSRSTQGQWSTGFSAVHFANPRFGQQAAVCNGDVMSCVKEDSRLRKAISCINKMRPKFVVVNGNFTAASHDSGGNSYSALNKEFRRCMARISETIPVLYVPGENDVGLNPTPESIAHFHSLYGCDYYGFWFGGVRLLIINSSLLISPDLVPRHAAAQHTWLLEELEQCKLCAMQVVVFSYHSFFEDDDDTSIKFETSQGNACRRMPEDVRKYWLPRFRNRKVKFLFSSNSMEGLEVRAHASSIKRKVMKLSTKVEDENVTSLVDVTVDVDSFDEEEAKSARRKARDDGKRGSELKPSEILAQAKGSDDNLSFTSSDSSDNEDEFGEANTNDRPAINSEKVEKDKLPDGEYEDSSPFSPDLKYSGPIAINTPPMGGVGGREDDAVGVFRVLDFEDEETAKQSLYDLENIPSKLATFV